MLTLARIQFATNISFHILFPAITIALGWILLFFKFRYHKSKNEKWMELYFLFTKIFALSFAIGVVSGVVMSFQFGTNWAGFMNKVGNIAGPLLAYEVLTAFFLEASFLAVMLFGFKKVKPWVHNLATFLVAFGTTLSAFWIIALNSWMHTPSGFEMIDGIAYPTSWLKIILNPSMPYRFGHMLVASFLTAGFLVCGLLSYRFLNGDKSKTLKSGLKSMLIMLTILAPLQIFIGDLHGLNTLKYQPQKIAAIEAIWHDEKGAPLVLFAIPDEKKMQNNFAIEIPNGASLILKHEKNASLQGISSFKNNHPPVAPLFFAFRIMVACGMLMLFLAFFGLWQIIKRGEISRNFARILTASTFLGWIGILSGWYVTEIGRQPWLVNGIITTAQAASPVSSGNMIFSLSAYLLVYIFLLGAYVRTIFYIAKKQK